MDKVIVLLMAALLCCNFGRSSPLQGLINRDSRPPAPQQQQRVGKVQQRDGVKDGEADDLTYLHGGEPGEEGGGEGSRRRRLTATTATATTNSAMNQRLEVSRNTQREAQQQEHEAGGKATTTGRAPASVTTAAAAAAAVAGSGSTSIREEGAGIRTASGARRLSEDAADGSIVRGVQLQTMETVEGQGQGQQTLEDGGTVEAVEGLSAEDDKGIKEGEEEGFVVMAGDDKSGEGNPGDSLDNDNGSTSGISNNIMVIVFCALAFVANGGFLVYVFWVM